MHKWVRERERARAREGVIVRKENMWKKNSFTYTLSHIYSFRFDYPRMRVLVDSLWIIYVCVCVCVRARARESCEVEKSKKNLEMAL
jgi:hypothetical protein